MKTERRAFRMDCTASTSRLKAYEPLLDPHLEGFYGSPVVRRTMVRGGIITSKGEVIRREYNPRVPKVCLPPICYVSISKKTISPKQIRLLQVLSSPAVLPKPSLHPLKHEEYDQLLSHFCSPTAS